MFQRLGFRRMGVFVWRDVKYLQEHLVVGPQKSTFIDLQFPQEVGVVLQRLLVGECPLNLFPHQFGLEPLGGGEDVKAEVRVLCSDSFLDSQNRAEALRPFHDCKHGG